MLKNASRRNAWMSVGASSQPKNAASSKLYPGNQRANLFAMREWPANERCLARDSCTRRCTDGSSAVNTARVIQVGFTVNFLVSMKFLFIQFE
jgi:hypothetical protein